MESGVAENLAGFPPPCSMMEPRPAFSCEPYLELKGVSFFGTPWVSKYIVTTLDSLIIAGYGYTMEEALDDGLLRAAKVIRSTGANGLIGSEILVDPFESSIWRVNIIGTTAILSRR
jgi:hypothetical protein